MMKRSFFVRILLLYVIGLNTLHDEALAKDSQNLNKNDKNGIQAENFINSGVQKQIKYGIKQLMMLGKNGHANSIVDLSLIYLNGFPVYIRPQIIKENAVLSYSYALIAASLGHDYARQILDMTERWDRELNSAQFAEAKSMAASWHPGSDLPIATKTDTPHELITRIGDDKLFIHGPIYKGAFNELKSKLDKNIKEIILDSEGGWTADGIKMGLLIQDAKVTSVVDGECMSACANYLFIGAPIRIIKKGSLVCFHGGAQKIRDLEQLLNEIKNDDTPENDDKKKSMDDIRHSIRYADRHLEKMENRLLDFYEIDRRILSTNFKIITRGTGKISPLSVEVYCPDKTALSHFGIKTEDLRDSLDHDELYEFGKKYNWLLVASDELLSPHINH